jgi:Holliday junction resolvase RusA-like endonuclease
MIHTANGYRWGPAMLVFRAHGHHPVGQGAIRPLGKGRPSVHANAKTLKPWRKTIAEAAQKAIQAHRDPEMFPLRGPLAAYLLFTMPYGKTAARERRQYPTVTSATNSDIDHLERAVYDALKGTAIVDDCQIVDAQHPKTYPTGSTPYAHPLADSTPGVLVALYQLPQEAHDGESETVPHPA